MWRMSRTGAASGMIAFGGLRRASHFIVARTLQLVFFSMLRCSLALRAVVLDAMFALRRRLIIIVALITSVFGVPLTICR
jgi:hypothetical protein